MTRSCDELPDPIRIGFDAVWSEFAQRMVKVGSSAADGSWTMRCRDCGQAWRVDHFREGRQVALAIKVPSVDTADWSETADREARIRYLERSLGGLSATRCVWQDCPHLALAGIAMCAMHLYDSAPERAGRYSVRAI